MRLLILAAATAATVVLLQGSGAGAARTDPLDIWKPIKNLSDPYVREIAEFAVEKHNEKSQTKLVLNKVVKGERLALKKTADLFGTTYRLVVEVKDGADLKSYDTVVWDRKPVRILLLFKALKANV
ncbi:hypothetical protein BT93_E1269 [Corymbia citriodora subsp. variegata]|nr:hypothetical protein BT93_E1269 [Corymbia citriodora subsp. variegata]